MYWITETIAILLVAGALVLLGLGRIGFEQAISIITLGVGIVTGKYFSKLDAYISKKYGIIDLMRRYQESLSAVAVGDGKVTLYILPDFLNTEIEKRLVESVRKIHPGLEIEVKRGERIEAV